MENALVHILTGLGMAAFGFLAVGAARKPALVDERAQAIILRHGLPIKILAFLSLLLPIPGIALLIIGPANAAESWLCAGYIWGFGLLAAYTTLEAFWTRVVLVPEGIMISTAWGGIKSLAWEDVRDVTFSGANKWFVIHGPHGQKIRISIFLVGIAELESAVRSRVPWERYRKAEKGFALVAKGFWQ